MHVIKQPSLAALSLLMGALGASSHSSAQAQRLAEFQLPAAERAPWRFEGFPIVGWWSPPGTATLADIERYRDAGFTLYFANFDEGIETPLEHAEAVGLPVLLFGHGRGSYLREHGLDYPASAENVVGWMTHDEPGHVSVVEEAITTVNDLMREDPSRRAFFNMLPPYAQPEPGAEAVIDCAVRNGLPILSYNHYYLMADGTTLDEPQFEYLELFRRKSLEHGIPFWAFALTTQHYGYRRPSESDVRYSVYSNLAYGAKGLWYFTYWGPTDWEGWDTVAIVNPADGSPAYLYDVVRDINQAVLQVGDLLLDLTSTAVVHSDPPAGCQPFEPGSQWITGLEADDALIGFFEDSAGERYALVVNKVHAAGTNAAETARAITLTFAPEVRAVEALSWLDGTTGPIDIDGGQAALQIAGGTGVLLRVRADSLSR